MKWALFVAVVTISMLIIVTKLFPFIKASPITGYCGYQSSGEALGKIFSSTSCSCFGYLQVKDLRPVDGPMYSYCYGIGISWPLDRL